MPWSRLHLFKRFSVAAPVIAFLAVDGVRRGFAPWEKSALAFLWIAPRLTRTVAEHTLIPLDTPAMRLVLALVLRRAADETGMLSRWNLAAQPIK